jgi:formylglycine-generating enzyme required for sulfatase activity
MGTDSNVGFCAWASEVAGFSLTLPTETQWEFASRGGQDEQEFPWGNKLDDSKLWCSGNTKRTCTGSVVRSHNIYRNVYGLTDMAGNVWEWCSDWYADTYTVPVRTQWIDKTRMVRAAGVSGLFGRMTEEPYKHEVVEVLDVNDPSGPQNGQYRCVRGGSWDDFNPDVFRCANRSGDNPEYRNDNFGFRLSAGPG